MLTRLDPVGSTDRPETKGIEILSFLLLRDTEGLNNTYNLMYHMNRLIFLSTAPSFLLGHQVFRRRFYRVGLFPPFNVHPRSIRP